MPAALARVSKGRGGGGGGGYSSEVERLLDEGRLKGNSPSYHSLYILIPRHLLGKSGGVTPDLFHAGAGLGTYTTTKVWQADAFLTLIHLYDEAGTWPRLSCLLRCWSGCPAGRLRHFVFGNVVAVFFDGRVLVPACPCAFVRSCVRAFVFFTLVPEKKSTWCRSVRLRGEGSAHSCWSYFNSTVWF